MIAYGRMANSIFLRGGSREKECGFSVLPDHSPPPPPKGECLECVRVTLLRPAGRWRGDTVEMKFGADAVFVVGFGRKY